MIEKQAVDEQTLVDEKERSRNPVSIVLKISFQYISCWYILSYY